MNQKVENIDGVVYIINQFKGVEGLRNLQKCIKYSGGFAAGLFGGGVGVLKQELLSSLVTGNLAQAFANVDDPELTKFIIDLTNSTTVNGQPIDFDTQFARNYFSLFKLIKAIIAFNYDDVFTKLGTSVKSELSLTEG